MYICLARPELEQAGITGHGPCVNKVYSISKVTFLEGAKPFEFGEKEEEEDVNQNVVPTADTERE